MTPEEWQAIADEVLAALQDVGFGAHIVRPGVETGPEHRPVAGPPTVHACTVLRDEYSLFEQQGTQIQRGDQRFMLAAADLGFAPTVSDKLRIAGKDLHIVSVTPFAPGGEVVYFELQVRG